MKVVVGYKHMVDYNVRIQVKPDGSGMVTDGVKLSPDSFGHLHIAMRTARQIDRSGHRNRRGHQPAPGFDVLHGHGDSGCKTTAG